MLKAPRIVLIDNYDSFTFNIWDYLSRAGAQVEVRRRNEIRSAEIFGYDGVVFSPGPGNPTAMPDLLKLIESAVSQKPTLGICLGFQAIAHFYGATIEKGNPTHGKLSKVHVVKEGNLLEGVSQPFYAVRYHSLIVNQLKSPLMALAFSVGKELMAFEHESLPVAGVQYHPEACLTQFGQKLLNNWLDLC